MRAISMCALAAILIAVTAVAAQDKKDAVDAKKLVGKWEPVEKKGLPIVIEFTGDGKINMAVGESDKLIKIAGTYKIDGNKIAVQLKFMEEDIKESLTVKKQTDDELTTEDSKGKSDMLKRVKVK